MPTTKRTTRRARHLTIALLSLAAALILPASQALAGATAYPTGTLGPGGTISGNAPGAHNPLQPWAGLVQLALDGGTTTWAYCIDLHHELLFGAKNKMDEVRWTRANVPNLQHIARILDQHPADHTVATGNNTQAAAVQAAIWHFSDGFTLTGATGGSAVLTLYNTIVADATTHPVQQPTADLDLQPPTQHGAPGDLLKFTLDTTAKGKVDLAVHGATAEIVDCSTHQPIDHVNGPGKAIPICLHHSGGNATATLVASTASATIPAGRVFLRTGSQKIIIAAPRLVTPHASATAIWQVVIVTTTQAPASSVAVVTTEFPTTAPQSSVAVITTTGPASPSTTSAQAAAAGSTSTTTASTSLAFTGPRTLPLVFGAALLLLIGIASLLAAQRRRPEP